jgi:hypothetical protein
LLNESVVLLNGLITNDKFCLSRVSRQKLRMLAVLVLSLVRPSIFMRTLAMKNIAEVRMKRQWRVRCQFQPTTNAERRWDQAYQNLLEWTLPIGPFPSGDQAGLLSVTISATFRSCPPSEGMT